MRRPILFAIAALATLGVGVFVGVHWQQADDTARGERMNRSRQPDFPIQEPRSEPAIHASISSNDARSRLLMDKISRLEDRLEDLSKQRDPAVTEHEPDSARVEPTVEQRIARNRARIQRIDQALDGEPRDGRWSAATSRVLEDLFVAVVPPGSSLSETTCGETFCRLVVRHENQKARDAFEVFPRKVPGMGVRGLIEHHDDGTEQTTLYVVRKEYDTPEHPVRLQDSTG